MTHLDDAIFLNRLKQQGYRDPRPLLGNGESGGMYAAIQPLMYTHAIIVGHMGDRFGYEDRWCYSSYEKAKAALDGWDGAGEPNGWHRHPDSDRRRKAEANELIEWIAP